MKLSSSQKKGFTVVELLITISVFLVLSVAVVGNYRTTTRGLALNSLANLVAADIRRAQSYGISSVATGNSFVAHGISFDKNFDNAYMLFADTGVANLQNGNLGATCSGECIERMKIQTGITITAICVDKKSGPCKNMDSVHIAFKRPNPEPSIIGIKGATKAYSDAEITFTTSDGLLSKTIVIWRTGLISIE